MKMNSTLFKQLALAVVLSLLIYPAAFASSAYLPNRAKTESYVSSMEPVVTISPNKPEPRTLQYISNSSDSKPERTISNKDTTVIRGQITNEKGTGLIGADILIKGTTTGTQTDAYGKFTIETPNKASILLVSHIGYQPMEIRVNHPGDLKIKMKTSAWTLSAITVSTGIQTIPKERATGSFDFIDNSALNLQAGTNIIDRIDGIANGVYFPKSIGAGNGPKFMIRGLSTINGPKDPLIIVDNFPYNGDVSNINPNDVKSITILKDAAAASIWGAKAGNGVVVITTKKGRLNKPIQVGFNTGMIVTGKPDLFSLPIISSSDYIDLEQLLFSKGFYNSTLNNTFSRPAVSPVVDILNDERNGTISMEEANNEIDQYRKIDVRNQYLKYMYQKAVTNQYNISINGGGRQMSYYLSAGYDKGRDVLDNKDDRLTIRLNNTYIPTKNLQLSLGIQYTAIKTISGKPGYPNIMIDNKWSIPYVQFSDVSGNPLPLANLYRTGYTDTAGEGKLLDWKYYPLEDWKHDFYTNHNQDLSATVGLNYRLAKGLHIDLKYYYEKQNGDSRHLQNLQSFAARNEINRFSQLDWSTGEVTYNVPLGGILAYYNTAIETQNVRGQMTFSHSWGKNEVNFLAGTEINQTEMNETSDKAYGYDGNTITHSEVDLLASYPDFISGSNRRISGGQGFDNSLNRFLSFYGNGAYTYNKKYTLTISARKDGSNLFGVSTINKWKPLWSSGLGWTLSEEPFYKSNLIPYLKIRATYGFSGNVNPAAKAITTLEYTGLAEYTNLQQASVISFSNPDLGWEKVKSINIGIDFQSKEDILSGSIEAYLKKGIGLFGPVPYDATDGLNLVGTITKNVASMSGKGVDIQLSSKNINGIFNWRSTLNLSYIKEKTIKYYRDPATYGISYVNTGSVIDPIQGKPLYALVTYAWKGLDGQGNPQGIFNKQISTDYTNLVYYTPLKDMLIKEALPVVRGSFLNSFRWKRLSLDVNIVYRLGYYFQKPSVYYSGLFQGGAIAGSADYANRWKQAGDEKRTNVPSLEYPANTSRDEFYLYSSALIENADNIKLQFINLSYMLNKVNCAHFPLEQLKMYLNVSNLGMIWCANKKKIDPDYINVPKPGKTFSLGIKAIF